MKRPPFKHRVRSNETKLQYSIYAHRELTRKELADVIRNSHEVKFDHPGSGTVEIVTMIGFRETGRKH